ncbi:ATP-binding protein [Roseiflexus castenholzii]|uniref:ATPase (AAA+ superfamily)-like protein n=1 Tax=Roseiflexus castenholzii (strain DSM 13941 / HLO8) TaxID=383372 RepID=A7NSC8_ROSCS|nr:ATP-binding protein [Roseiflexus castenholzii]ABU58557.1 ATPase (AAA+ superfamily)-like protein [Roseiflexus castenholzii DSM 13941]
MLIPRPTVINQITRLLAIHPIVALLGPRQCGKTTVARMVGEQQASTYFDLENPVDIRRLSAPLTVLETLSGLIIIDEVQQRPDLFQLLRVLVDRPQNNARFLLLGFASPHLVRSASESLAGRIGFVDLSGFDLTEVGVAQRDRLWVRGGFPRSFLADDDPSSMAWREAFIRTFLERDIPQLGITIPAEALRRFWTMVAHFHGQQWNAAEFARSLGASESTARRYLDILGGAYMVRVLPPWFENLGKRQVRSPKVYIRDSGILHGLLHLETLADVQSHPKLGASWEGFAVEQIIRLLDTRDAYFWATHSGAELDLLVHLRGRRYGFEIKYADAPGVTRSMRIALSDLGLEHLWVIYPGRQEYALTTQITVLPLDALPRIASALR